MELSIAKDYTINTGLRHCATSDKSGEDFYFTILNERFANVCSKNEELVVVFDPKKDGYSPSFIDEAFGNLVYDFSADIVLKHIKISAYNAPQITNEIYDITIPNWEKRRLNKIEPKITEVHTAWYRLINGKLDKKIWLSPKV